MAKTTYRTPHDVSGTVVTFNDVAYKATGLTFSKSDISSDDNIDTSTLDQVVGDDVNYQPRPLVGDSGSDTGWELSFDYIGNEPIQDGLEATISVTGGITVNGTGTCTASSVTLAVNDVVRGNATIRVERPDDGNGGD